MFEKVMIISEKPKMYIGDDLISGLVNVLNKLVVPFERFEFSKEENMLIIRTDYVDIHPMPDKTIHPIEILYGLSQDRVLKIIKDPQENQTVISFMPSSQHYSVEDIRAVAKAFNIYQLEKFINNGSDTWNINIEANK